MDAPAMEDAAMRRWLLLALACAGCGGSGSTGEPEGPPSPQVTLYGVRIQYFKAGALYSTGRAAKLTYQRAGGDFTGLEGSLKLSGGEARALSFEGNLSAKQATGKDGVVFRTTSGATGKTPVAHW